MDTLDKIAALVFKAAGSTYSWSNIIASLLFSLVLFALNISCDTIFHMNETIINVATWMFLISLFLAIHKTCSTIGDLILSARAQKKAQAQLALEKQRSVNTLLALSAKEIGLLKFILHQEFQSAWLLPNSTIVIILAAKKLIQPVDILPSQHTSVGNDEVLTSLFTIPENVKNIIADMPPELAARWRKVRINNSFAQFQD